MTRKATLAPVSAVSAVSAPCPAGPVRVSEMLGTLNGPAYIERVSVHDVPHIRKAKAAIKKAFQLQMEGRGFTMVEVLSTCPTNWGKTPQESMQWVKDAMMPVYPLGVFKDVTAQPVAEGGAV